MRLNNNTLKFCTLFLVLVILLVIISASCSPQITKIVPEHTRELFPTITLSVTSTTNPTKTPIPTKTPYPTIKPNTIPVTIWATDMPQPIQLQDFLGSWSPVSNSLAGVLRHDNLTTGSLVLLEAPAFSISKLDPQHTDKVLPKITISPDGNQILYGVTLEPEKVDILFDISGVMLRLDTRTGKIIPTNYSFIRGLSFWGWMDDQTVVITSYSGGGHESIASWNYETKKSLLQDTLPVYSLGTLHYPYAAVNSFMTIGYMAYVMLPDPKPEQGNEPCLLTCRSNIFPSQKITSSDPHYVESFSQDWLPGTNKLLVAVRDFGSRDLPKAGLVLWDVTTGQITNVMGSGVYGQYSPDGKFLAWVNYGQSDGPAPASGATALEPINMDNQTYLHLKDLANGKTILSLPVFGWTIEEASTDSFLDPYLTFSPDSQWITLVTPGKVQYDEVNWYVEDSTGSPYKYYLNVIDLKNRRVVKSIEIQSYVDFGFYHPIWSPRSNRFVYQDKMGNWQMFDVNTATLTSISQADGKLVTNPSWSFDGRYLQLVSETSLYNFGNTLSPRCTYIFDLNNK